jgi:hypothetical protein
VGFSKELNSINEKLIALENDKIKELKQKLNKLADALIDENLDKKLFKAKYNLLETEIAESEQKLSNINNPISNFEKSAKNTIRFFRNTLNMWTNGDLTIKRQIQKIMFPDGLVYSKEKQQYLTFEKNNLLHLISILSSNYSNKKADFSIVKLNKSA